MPHRLVIGRCAADEDELLGAVTKQFEIRAYVIGCERDEVDDCVVVLPLESRSRLLGAPDVGRTSASRM
jgi:hypothetical protein